jgi:charged multivesicular body protein 1
MSFFGFGGSKTNLDDELFNLKFASKQLQKESKKAEKEMMKEKEKVKKAMQSGRNDIAQIHASNAIMQKNQSLSFLKMSSRIDAVSGKLSGAIKMQKVTGSMAQITKTMGKVLQTMKLDKIQETMDKFEKAFEDTDVMSATVTGAMDSSTSMATPQSEIEDLMKEVADENQLEYGEAMARPQQASVAQPQAAAANEDDELLRRLNELKAPN